jgi:hypothetical protein
MPANVGPEYKAAEAAFRRARDPRERLECLHEMLRTIPKHKGTERLQAEIKTRIKQLTDEVAGPRRGGARHGPTHVIRPEGAAQIALIGPPNVGKSALHARLTGSHAEVAPYPFATVVPLPGMLPHQDIHFQLVDLPPICRDHPLPWIANALQPADGCMLVVDLQEPDCIERVVTIRELLAEKRIILLPEPRVPRPARGETSSEDARDDPIEVRLLTLLVATKCDRSSDPRGELAAFHELMEERFPAVSVSAATGAGLEQIGPWWFEALGIVRIYTKIPGHAPDLSQPFTLRRGETVLDVARLVHKEVAGRLKYARLWGSGEFSGQQVGRDHPVSDGDVVELHI